MLYYIYYVYYVLCTMLREWHSQSKSRSRSRVIAYCGYSYCVRLRLLEHAETPVVLGPWGQLNVTYTARLAPTNTSSGLYYNYVWGLSVGLTHTWTCASNARDLGWGLGATHSHL